MKLRSVLIGLLALAAITVVAYRNQVYSPATVEGTNTNIVVVTGGSGSYWQMISQGAKAAADDLGLSVDVQMPTNDESIEEQVQILNGIDLETVDAVALSPLDAEAQTRLINRISSEAYVITIDSDAPLSERLSYVGASNHAAGRKCAELVAEALPEGGEVAVLIANLVKNNLVERRAGFEDYLFGDSSEEASIPPIKVVDFLVDEGDDERCATQIRELLEATPDIDCIVGMNARHGPILLDVLKEAGKLDSVKLITFDTPEPTLEGVESGHVYATIAQDPYQYGYEAVSLLASYNSRSREQLPPAGLRSTMTIPTPILKKEDLSSFRATLEKRLSDQSSK